MIDLTERMGFARDDDEKDQAMTGDLFSQRERLVASLFRGILREECL